MTKLSRRQFIQLATAAFATLCVTGPDLVVRDPGLQLDQLDRLTQITNEYFMPKIVESFYQKNPVLDALINKSDCKILKTRLYYPKTP